MVIKGQSDIEVHISDIGYICLKQQDSDGEHVISAWLAAGAVLFITVVGIPGRGRAVARHRHLGALPHHPRLARALVAKGTAAVAR